jgi:hypothetical protein
MTLSVQARKSSGQAAVFVTCCWRGSGKFPARNFGTKSGPSLPPRYSVAGVGLQLFGGVGGPVRDAEALDQVAGQLRMHHEVGAHRLPDALPVADHHAGESLQPLPAHRELGMGLGAERRAQQGDGLVEARDGRRLLAGGRGAGRTSGAGLSVV